MHTLRLCVPVCMMPEARSVVYLTMAGNTIAATAAATDAPKMPHRIRAVHEQVMAHPDYTIRLDANTRFAFEGGCVSGYSHCTRENNRWSRELWRLLYLTSNTYEIPH